jgi:hypothetical protein
LTNDTVAPLLRALERQLSEVGYVRSGVVVRRLVEPGLFHMLEVVRAGDCFTINVRIPVDLGACSGGIWALIPAAPGHGSKLGDVFGSGSERSDEFGGQVVG